MTHLVRAPRSDGEILIYPGQNQIADAYEESRRRLASFQEGARQRARREVRAALESYLTEMNEPIPSWPEGGWIVAGHQPEIFHPGVWIKNFAIQHWARKWQATPINLVVDNDAVKSTKILVPAGQRMISVAFDDGVPGAPHEEVGVHSEALFSSFARRVGDVTHAWPFTPMLSDFWEKVCSARSANRGDKLVVGRRALERAWGYAPLEVPLSRVCQTRAFAEFAVSLVEQAPHFAEVYNGAVHAYRARHHLRSESHPVPDLTHEGDWHEAPFWGWKSGQRRERVFVRTIQSGWQLRVGSELLPSVSGAPESRFDQWQQFASLGWKLRTRALTTTLFARLFLADLFVHGIGGGKYDEVADDIMRGFWQIDPPAYAIVSATKWLPLPRYPEAATELAAQQHLARDLVWNPQRHVYQPADLLAQKHAWIERPAADHDQRRLRFQQLRTATNALQPFIAEPLRQTAKEIARLEGEVRSHELHTSREMAFCLFPEEWLRSFFAL